MMKGYAALGFMLLMSLQPGSALHAQTGARWVTASLSAQDPGGDRATVPDETIRQIVRFEASGSQVRLFVSNEAGREAVRADSIRLALLADGRRIRPDTVRQVTFGLDRKDSITLVPGGSGYSSPIDLSVQKGDEAVISVHFPAQSAALDAMVTEGYRVAGNHTDDRTLPAGSPARHLHGIVERVDVVPTTARSVLVAIGDSITAGFNSTLFKHKSYPEQLSDRLSTLPGGNKWSVINAGISGNRVLHDGKGPSLVSRFAHDALDVSGVKTVLVLEGINDIGHPAARRHADNPQPVTAEQLIAAFRRLVVEAHAHDVRIYFGTILPFGSAAYFSPAGETTRERVNGWIRSNKEADGFVEMALAMADPGITPSRIKSTLSGNGDPRGRGGLHPNDAGYGVMADQVAATLFDMGRSKAQAAGH